jgi:hypothetical protein
MISSDSVSLHTKPSLEDEDPILTVQEVAAWLRVKPSWVAAHAARRRLLTSHVSKQAGTLVFPAATFACL